MGDTMHLLGMGRLPPQAGWHMGWHQHDFNELIVVMRGRLQVRRAPGELIEAGSGDLLEYPAGCSHDERTDDGDPAELVFFSYTGPAGGSVTRIHDSGGRARALAEWLHSSRQASHSRAEPMRQALLAALVEEVQRLREGSVAPQTIPELVHEYMLQHLSSPVELDDLANVATMSKFHFAREYRRLTGTTPIAALRMVRLKEARNLLRSTSLPLKAIAPMVGFADEHHLSRACTKYLGEGPRKIRIGS